MSVSSTINLSARANIIGSSWMIGAMAAFAVEDGFLKAASAQLPVGQVLILFGLGGACLFAIGILWRGETLFSKDVVSPTMRLRMFFEIIGRLFYVLALISTSLSSTTAILQATPLVVVLGAAVLFGEKVGWRRWFAIGLGLIGVLIILRPTAESFSISSLLAVIGMLGFAGRDLASRAAPLSLSAFVLGLYGFLAVVFAGIVFSLWQGQAFVWPAMHGALYMVGAVLFGTVAYVSLMKAMRTGEVSSVTPFRYTRLLFGIGLGLSVFGETLDVPMMVGSSVIVLSGLFILRRSTRIKETSAGAPV